MTDSTMAVTTIRRPASTAALAQSERASYRIASIDIIRGAVMVLMAIDHVRVFSGVPAGGPTPGVFFTRWVTHFVAPAFVFLAGAAAFLHGTRLSSRGQLARFLFTRGAWLVLLEMTVIRVAWTFNFDFGSYLLAGVIWVIGWSMMAMAALVFLPATVVGFFGVAVIALHNPLPAPGPWLGQAGPAWLLQLLYYGGGIGLGDSGPQLAVLYTFVPWIGVIAAGYGFGSVIQRAPAQRRTLSIRLGLALIAAFLLLRTVDAYGDPRPWRPPPPPAEAVAATQSAQPPAMQRPAMPTALAFLNTSKYPASLLFLLMTLGPVVLALGLLEGTRAATTAPARVLAVFGSVPLFYYLLHIPAIHSAALIVSLLRTGTFEPWLFENHPVMVPPPPEGYTWSLPLLYIVTAIVVAILYIPCRWFAAVRQRRRDLTWLSYL
ncbi:MAG: DUF1624 domain-containing protein [Longimicrobiales bacterium]